MLPVVHALLLLGARVEVAPVVEVPEPEHVVRHSKDVDGPAEASAAENGAARGVAGLQEALPLVGRQMAADEGEGGGVDGEADDKAAFVAHHVAEAGGDLGPLYVPDRVLQLSPCEHQQPHLHQPSLANRHVVTADVPLDLRGQITKGWRRGLGGLPRRTRGSGGTHTLR